MKFRILCLLFVFAVSCSVPAVKVEVKKPGKDANVSVLKEFFVRSESDSVRAGAVIEKHNIIQQLTHLRLMDTGGKKFYLLERENITEMINSVTEGIYLDYVLINKHGDIIYTRNNDSLFGTNVNEGYEETPLKKCFVMRRGVYFEDVSLLTPTSSVYSLYVSTPVYVQQKFHGILVLQIDIFKINEILEKDTEIVNRKGIIKIAADTAKINSLMPGYSKINPDEIDRKAGIKIGGGNTDFDLKSFRFNSISWILVKKKA